jgi:hypothetical protein
MEPDDRDGLAERVAEVRHTLQEMLTAAEGMVCAIRVQQGRLAEVASKLTRREERGVENHHVV